MKELINIFGALTSIISFFLVSFINPKKRNKKGNRYLRRTWFFSILFALICILLIVSIILVILSEEIDYRLLWLTIIVISVIALFIYGIKARNSFDEEEEDILPPKIFWQMLFNKLPLHLPNTASKVVKFAVVSMDNCDAVKKIKAKIKKNYDRKKDFDFELLDINGFNENQKNNFVNLNNVLKDKSIRGVLFLIGTSADNSLKELKDTIENYADSHEDIPIAYYRAGNEKNFSLSYERIGTESINDFVKHLVLRGYYRNNKQFHLGRSYQKSFIIQGILLTILFVGLFITLNKFGEQEKIINEKTEKIISHEKIISDQGIKISNQGKTINEKDKIIHGDLPSIYLRPDPLRDDIWTSCRKEKTGLLKEFCIESFRKDSAMVSALKDFSNYYFDDLENFSSVKLWYRNNTDTPKLECVFNSEDINYRKSIPVDNYMLGQVVNYKLFILFPSSKFISNCSNNTKLVWYFNGDKDTNINEVEGRITNTTIDGILWFWEGDITEGGKTTNIKVPWNLNGHPEPERGSFGFSYDGCLAVEVCINDFTQKDYDYMSHLMFRNSLRKYIKIVGEILNLPKYKYTTKKDY